MNRTLCRPCAEKLKQHKQVRFVSGGRDNKITCAECGCRRYGALYDVRRKGRRA